MHAKDLAQIAEVQLFFGLGFGYALAIRILMLSWQVLIGLSCLLQDLCRGIVVASVLLSLSDLG